MDSTEQLESQTNIKDNIKGYDTNNTVYDRVVRDKVRLWHKIIRTYGEASTVLTFPITFPITFTENTADPYYNRILPYNTLYEPFNDTSDVDLRVDNCAYYDENNQRFVMYKDLSDNYKVIQSKIICLEHNHKISKISIAVYGTREDGTKISDEIMVEIYNGRYWIPVVQDTQINSITYNGADLDADLDADLYQDLNNYDYSTDSFIYEHSIKYRITNISDYKLYIDKVILRVIWEF